MQHKAIVLEQGIKEKFDNMLKGIEIKSLWVCLTVGGEKG